MAQEDTMALLPLTDAQLRSIERQFTGRADWPRGTAPLADQLRPAVVAAMATELLEQRASAVPDRHLKTTKEWRGRRRLWMESASQIAGVVHDEECIDVHEPCAVIALLDDIDELRAEVAQLKAAVLATWYVMESGEGTWLVVVEAPRRELGGWAILMGDEHSARLACDVLNFVTGTGDTAYSDAHVS